MSEKELIHSELTRTIIGAAMEVHRHLGKGFLESVYEEALAYEFELRGFCCERQKKYEIFYKERPVKYFVCDFAVEQKVIVELKAIKQITDIETAQVINYLMASGIQVGLVLNFGYKSLEYQRLVNSKPRNLRNPRL